MKMNIQGQREISPCITLTGFKKQKTEQKNGMNGIKQSSYERSNPVRVGITVSLPHIPYPSIPSIFTIKPIHLK